jgi:hypothetical protein
MALKQILQVRARCPTRRRNVQTGLGVVDTQHTAPALAPATSTPRGQHRRTWRTDPSSVIVEPPPAAPTIPVLMRRNERRSAEGNTTIPLPYRGASSIEPSREVGAPPIPATRTRRSGSGRWREEQAAGIGRVLAPSGGLGVRRTRNVVEGECTARANRVEPAVASRVPTGRVLQGPLLGLCRSARNGAVEGPRN